MSKVNVVIGAMAGIAIGALLGVLFAPEDGKATRRKISKKSRESADSLKDKFNEFVDTISDSLHKTKEEVADAVQE